MRISRQFILGEVNPNKFAAFEHDHVGMLVLKGLRCNIVNDLSWFVMTWFISAEALSWPEVFF